MYCACDPAMFIQHSNIYPEAWGVGCPLLRERVGSLSPNNEILGQEAVHNFCQDIKLWLGRKGLTIQVHLMRKEEGRQYSLGNESRNITCGNYATSGSGLIYTSGYVYVQIHMFFHASCDEAPCRMHFGQNRQVWGRLLKYHW